MHLGGHDLLPENYVSELKKTLQATPEAVGAFAPCHFFVEEREKGTQNCSFVAFRRNMHSENPYERAVNFVTSDHPCDLLFGLFRSRDFTQAWEECLPIAGCDHVFLFDMLLRGPFAFSDQTMFLRRDVHGERDYKVDPRQKDNAYMERITGKAPVIKERSYLPMVREMLIKYENFSTDRFESSKSKYYWILYYTLKRQFKFVPHDLPGIKPFRTCSFRELFLERFPVILKELLRKYIFHVCRTKDDRLRVKLFCITITSNRAA